MRLPDYEPAWGKPQFLQMEERLSIHKRWLKNLGEWDNKQTFSKDGVCRQCGGCSYYIPLKGSFGSDWGVCCQENSKFNGKVVFEHFSCEKFKSSE